VPAAGAVDHADAAPANPGLGASARGAVGSIVGGSDDDDDGKGLGRGYGRQAAQPCGQRDR
jgi:hypothetical protein